MIYLGEYLEDFIEGLFELIFFNSCLNNIK